MTSEAWRVPQPETAKRVQNTIGGGKTASGGPRSPIWGERVLPTHARDKTQAEMLRCCALAKRPPWEEEVELRRVECRRRAGWEK